MFPFDVENVEYTESYTETWAEILNCGLISFLDSKTNYEDFSLFFNFYMKVEIVHSILQANKILKHYGLDFDKLRENNTKWCQDTHVFEYHVVKTMLLSCVNEFMRWCERENGKNMIPFKKKRNLVPFIPAGPSPQSSTPLTYKNKGITVIGPAKNINNIIEGLENVKSL